MNHKRITVSLSVLIVLVAIFIVFNEATSTNDAFSDGNYMKNYNVYALQTPTSANFAGEDAPLERWYVKERLDRELLVNTYWQSNMLLLIKRSNRFFPMIERILNEENVPSDLKYIAVTESGLIPTAVSPARASGLWQFMRGTGKEYGLEINKEVDERYHIEKATRAACRYLKKAKDSLGNWTLAAAAYNAGRKGIKKQMKRQDASNYYDLLLNEETGRYVYRILALKTILENPQKYGFKFCQSDLYEEIPTKKIKVTGSINDLATWAKQHGINYPILKEFNPWLRDNVLKNKHKKTYHIKVPKQGWADFQHSSYQQ